MRSKSKPKLHLNDRTKNGLFGRGMIATLHDAPKRGPKRAELSIILHASFPAASLLSKTDFVLGKMFTISSTALFPLICIFPDESITSYSPNQDNSIPAS